MITSRSRIKNLYFLFLKLLKTTEKVNYLFIRL